MSTENMHTVILVSISATLLNRYHTDPETGVIIPQHLRERVVEYAANHTMEQVQTHLHFHNPINVD